MVGLVQGIGQETRHNLIKGMTTLEFDRILTQLSLFVLYQWLLGIYSSASH